MNLRSAIDGAGDLAHEDVTIPEWGGITVRLVEMSALDRILYDEATEALQLSGKPVSRLHELARFTAACLRDPATGLPIYGPQESDALVRRNTRVLIRLFEAAVRLNMEAPDGLSPKA